MSRQKHILIAATAMTLLLSGCKIGGNEVVFTTGVGNKDLFKINGESCSLKEAKVYLINYQNLYGTAYGVDLWENESCSDSLEEYVKNLTVSELSRVICMDFLAKEKNITLTEEEQQKVEKAAKAYFKSLNDAEKKYTVAVESDIIKLYQNYALAQKTYDSLTESVDEEVSDNEARVMEIMQIYVTSKETADLIATKLSEGGDFASLASNYNEASDIEITVARGDLPEKVEKIAFEMENEDVSDCIEVENGYYFIRCVNKFDEELTDANKEKIVAKREKEAFEDEYESLISGFSSTINETDWDQVEIDLSGEITTDSFFTVFDKYYEQ